jgi:hypothetical protein
MGMDVSGCKPTAPVGEYFRNNVWGWHPLWSYVENVAPHLVETVLGHSNDGDGLSSVAAGQLAVILTAELESGRTGDYAAKYTAELDAMPDEPCRWCDATGTRTDAVGQEAGFAARGYCNGCQSKGTVRPHDAWYGFDVENVTKFRAVVAASGGFEIW